MLTTREIKLLDAADMLLRVLEDETDVMSNASLRRLAYANTCLEEAQEETKAEAS